MNRNEANSKLKEYGQEHILDIASKFGYGDDEQLMNQIEQTDFEVIELGKNAAKETERGIITPIEVMSIDEIASKEQEYREAGTRAIRDGKVGAVLLAGGMGTRLGSDSPKGVYNIGITKDVYIFERLICNLMDVVEETGAYIHLFVMTSEKNNDETTGFFKEHGYFGYPEEYIHFFMQEMAPATDYDGKVYMEATNRIATSPNGNGGWYSSIIRAGRIK
jgi:UDP-N-acetylglucosamine/UDP-N-acetylgalactosamine diphosphorylase